MPRGSSEYEVLEYVDEDGFHHLPKDEGLRNRKRNARKKSHIQEGFHWKWSGINALKGKWTAEDPADKDSLHSEEDNSDGEDDEKD